MSTNTDPRTKAVADLPLGGEFTMNGVTYRKVRLAQSRGGAPGTSCMRCPFYQAVHPDPCARLYLAAQLRPCSDPTAVLGESRMHIANVDEIPVLVMKGLLA